jgi:hypothetical protein
VKLSEEAECLVAYSDSGTIDKVPAGSQKSPFERDSITKCRLEAASERSNDPKFGVLLVCVPLSAVS